VNREGKSYRSERIEDKSKINGSIVIVTCSKKWSPDLEDAQSNFTHTCLVLECPQDPAAVGREIRLDERKYRSSVTKLLTSTWDDDDKYIEI